MQCPRCQMDNADERVYCWKCLAPLRSGAMGTPIATTHSPVNQTVVAPTKARSRTVTVRKSSPIKSIIITLLVLLLLSLGGIGGFGLYISKKNPPDKIAQEFFSALIKADFETMKQLVIPEQHDTLQQEKGQFQKALEYAKKFIPNYDPSQFDRYIQTSVASVERPKWSEVNVNLSVQFNLNIPNLPTQFELKIELPVILVRRYIFLWKVDYQKTESAMQVAVMRQIAPLMRQFGPSTGGFFNF